MSEPVLRVEDLSKRFAARGAQIEAVSGVTFDVAAGETVALVGESGCGKSTTARCIVRLLEPTSGRILFRGEDITALSTRQFRTLRRDVQMVFQDPHASLNPSMTVRQTLREPLRLNGGRGAASEPRLRELMDLVHLPPEFLGRRTGQLSGGQKQRVGIARAVAMRPAFVVLDEPTSALDMSLRGSLLALLSDLQHEFDMAYLFITHDLSTVRQLADRVVVMYRGAVVETGATDDVLDTPTDAYTRRLIAAIPVPDPDRLRPRRPPAGEANADG